jgi:integrase
MGKRPRTQTPKARIYGAEQRQLRQREHAHELLEAATQGMDADWAGYARDFVDSRQSSGTAEAYAGALAAYFRWCRGRGIEPRSINRRQADLFPAAFPGQSSASVHLKVAAVRSFHATLIGWGIIDWNPFDRVRVKAETRTPTPALESAEFDQLLATVEEDFDHPQNGLTAVRDYVAIYLAGRVGLRRSELATAVWGDLRGDPPHSILIHGKGDRHVEVGLPEDVRSLLDGWRQRIEGAIGRRVGSADTLLPGMNGDGRVRTNARGQLLRVSPDRMSGIIRDRMRDVGLDGERYAAHALRATSATLAWRAGADTLDISAMLRHKSLDTTQIYIKRARSGENRAASNWAPAAAGRSIRLGLKGLSVVERSDDAGAAA